MEIIREIINEEDLKNSVRVIRDSFSTVAVEFGLTQGNCPTHPSFTTIDKLCELKKKGTKFLGLFQGGQQIGFVAIEQADNALYCMEKLAVLPEHRHKGYGKKLMGFVFEQVKMSKGERISIGIINESTVLKNWYIENGFAETGTKKFEHLSFTVCFMEKSLLP